MWSVFDGLRRDERCVVLRFFERVRFVQCPANNLLALPPPKDTKLEQWRMSATCVQSVVLLAHGMLNHRTLRFAEVSGLTPIAGAQARS